MEYEYLCLLDDVDLAADIELEGFSVRNFSATELVQRLRGRDDLAPSKEEQATYERHALFPWASTRIEPAPMTLSNRWPNVPQIVWDRTDFYRVNSTPESNWPFDRFLLTLNLLKASSGPVLARHIYMLPTGPLQTKHQVLRMVRSEPLTRIYDPDEREGPAICEYQLGPEDAVGFSEVWRQLDRHLGLEHEDASVAVATRFFARADRQLVPYPEDHQAIDPLISYEIALEALLLREKEKGSDVDRLARRIVAIYGRQPPEIANFVRRIHWLRSKYLHGVRSVADLERIIIDDPDKEIQDPDRPRLGTPAGNYSSMLVKGGPFPGLLVNLREVARRCIRYLLGQCERGKTRDQILDALDAGQRP